MIAYEFQYQISLWIEQHVAPWVEQLFGVITEFGDVSVLALIMAFLYWNKDKRQAFRIAFSIALSFVVNSVLKYSFRNERPFYAEGLTKGIDKEVTGYSFPSGHSQNAGTLYTSLIIEFDKLWIKVFSVMMMVLIPLSRVILRVHWLQDIIVGLVLGILISALYYKYLEEKVFILMTHQFTLTVITPISFLVTVLAGEDNVGKGLGIVAGILMGYWLDDRSLNYVPGDDSKRQWIRFIVGVIGVLLIKEGLSLVFPDHVYFHYIRYFGMGIYITYLGPLMFTKLKLAN